MSPPESLALRPRAPRSGRTSPEYFPPLFLFTKHTVSSASVSTATATISPMNQPCAAMSSYRPAYPAHREGRSLGAPAGAPRARRGGARSGRVESRGGAPRASHTALSHAHRESLSAALLSGDPQGLRVEGRCVGRTLISVQALLGQGPVRSRAGPRPEPGEDSAGG